MGEFLKVVQDIQNEFATPPKNQFWRIKRNVKDPSIYTVLPNTLGFIAYLEGLGVCYEEKSKELVRYDNGIVSKVELPDLKRIVQKDILNFPDVLDDGLTREEVLNMVLTSEARLFKVSGLLDFLPQNDFNWLRSTADTSYHAYRNGIVKTTADGIELLLYNELKDCFIWETQIIDRDFELVEPNGDWSDFCWNAAGGTDELVKNFNSSLGYLLHTYKDSAKAYLVIFGEAVEDSDLGGGSGKSLTTNAISKILKAATKDMRLYSKSDAFAWSSVTDDTDILVLSDLKRGFDHTVLYNFITDHLEVNAKNKPVRVYEFEDSPKIVATTNYSLNTDAGHGNRRLRLVEFSDFFNEQRTPITEYGGLFFESWDETEWKRFDSYMLACVNQYLKNGFDRVDEGIGSKRKRILETSGNQDIMDWLNDYEERGFKKFSDVYLSYESSKYVSGRPVGKTIFQKRLEDVISIMDKQIEIAENGNVKSFKIW